MFVFAERRPSMARDESIFGDESSFVLWLGRIGRYNKWDFVGNFGGVSARNFVRF
jgi:hypothetical protein